MTKRLTPMFAVLLVVAACATPEEVVPAKVTHPGASMQPHQIAELIYHRSATEDILPSIHYDTQSFGTTDLTLTWSLAVEPSYPMFPNGTYHSEIMTAVYPTTFHIEGIRPVDRSNSFLIWGHDRRGNLVLERWWLTGGEAVGGVAIPGTVRKRDDLVVMQTSGIHNMHFLRDLTNLDSNGLGPAMSLVFMVDGVNDIYLVDLNDPTVGVVQFASVDQSASHVVPELAASYGQGISAKHVALGQYVEYSALGAPGAPNGDFLILQDGDLDGYPEAVLTLGRAYGDAIDIHHVTQTDADFAAGVGMREAYPYLD